MRTFNSDARIQENYLDAYKPIAVGQLHAVMQRPATSFFAPTRARRDYNAPGPIIPQFVAEQATSKVRGDRSRQIAAINGDFLRRASAAAPSYSILRPPEQRRGAPQQDIGKTPLKAMGDAVNVDTADVKEDFVERLMEGQIPFGPGYSAATPSARLALGSSRGRENLAPAAQALKGEVATYLDPLLRSEMTVISMMTRKGANNPMIVKRHLKEAPVVNELPEQPVESLLPAEEAPTPPPEPQTLGGLPLSIYKTGGTTAAIEYVKDPSSVDPATVPRKKKDQMAAFIADNLKLKGQSKSASRTALKKYTAAQMSQLITKYFPRAK